MDWQHNGARIRETPGPRVQNERHYFKTGATYTGIARINDGVRVNIAPLQLAGLLSDVLKTADATKAIADRARWRAAERLWVREGKLPHCGWLPEQVLESERWTAQAPEREAERRKLEAKRAAALARIGSEEMAGRQP